MRMKGWLAPSIVLVALSACVEADPGEVIPDLDVAELELALQELVQPLGNASEPNANLRSAFASLSARGFEFHRVDPLEGLRQAVRAARLDVEPTLLPVVIPSDLLGNTFVFDLDSLDWVIDEARTEAPDDGVRIIWYDTDRLGNIQFPLDPRGHIDLLERDTEELSQIAVRIFASAAEGDLTLVDLVHGYSTTSADPVTTRFEAAGFFSNGADTVDFGMVSSSTTSATSSDESYLFTIDLTGDETQYTLDMRGSQAGAEVVEDLTATLVHQGVTTVMDVGRAAGGTAGEQTGTLSYAGSVVANMLSTGQQFEFTPPAGGTFSRSQREELQRLTQILVFAGLTTASALPLLF